MVPLIYKALEKDLTIVGVWGIDDPLKDAKARGVEYKVNAQHECSHLTETTLSEPRRSGMGDLPKGDCSRGIQFLDCTFGIELHGG